MKDPTGQSLASGSEASLAWAGATPTRSVDSESTGCVIEPRKEPTWGRRSSESRKAASATAAKARMWSAHRGQTAGHVDKDSPGTWEIPPPPSRQTAGEPSTKTQARGRRRRAQRERTRRTDGTARTSQTRRAGAMGSRSAPIVPRRTGNHPEGPGGGKRGAGLRGPSKGKKD